MSDGALRCMTCKQTLGQQVYHTPDFVRCPRCSAPTMIRAFPALTRPLASTEHVTHAVGDEASCFYHSSKTAVSPCDHCGRFLCALCDVELDGQHICPTCLSAGMTSGRLRRLQTRCVMYDQLAFSLAVIPIAFIFITLFTAPMSLFLAVRYRKAPRSLAIPRSGLFIWLAVALSTCQIGAWLALIVFGISKVLT